MDEDGVIPGALPPCPLDLGHELPSERGCPTASRTLEDHQPGDHSDRSGGALGTGRSRDLPGWPGWPPVGLGSRGGTGACRIHGWKAPLQPRL